MVYRGLVKDGVVVVETGVVFQEGTVVNIEAAGPGVGCNVLSQTPTGLPELGHAEEIDRLIGGFRLQPSRQLQDVL